MSAHVKTLEEIEALLIEKGAECRWCGYKFRNGDIRTYKHPGGIKVKDYKEKQWVYMHCQNCGYDWALWKLLNQIKAKDEGVERC